MIRVSDNNFEERIVDLEVKLSFQNSTIEALSSVVNLQQEEIRELTRKLEQLKEHILNPEGIDPTRVKPPHY